MIHNNRSNYENKFFRKVYDLENPGKTYDSEKVQSLVTPPVQISGLKRKGKSKVMRSISGGTVSMQLNASVSPARGAEEEDQEEQRSDSEESEEEEQSENDQQDEDAASEHRQDTLCSDDEEEEDRVRVAAASPVVQEVAAIPIPVAPKKKGRPPGAKNQEVVDNASATKPAGKARKLRK